VEKGVRYIFPIHLTDNRFGGAAVYEDLFNYANKFSLGTLYQITRSPDPNITYRLSSGLDSAGNIGIKAILDGLSGIPFPPAFNLFDCPTGTLGCWDKFKLINGLMQPDPRYAGYSQTPAGHVNAKGLTPLGEFALKEMMRLGMLIDIDHMSEKAAARTLAMAEALSPEKYPLNMGHNGIRGANGNERAASLQMVQRLSATGGMFGLGTADIDPRRFIAGYKKAWDAMGGRATAIGSDVNGMEPLPKASTGLDSRAFYTGFTKSRTGSKEWDYTKEGVAHYGLMSDFLRDVRMQPDGPATVDNLMSSAEAFAVMWERCERVGPRVR
jgi:hypothetical protein